jgi:hypothetical protein
VEDLVFGDGRGLHVQYISQYLLIVKRAERAAGDAETSQGYAAFGQLIADYVGWCRERCRCGSTQAGT